MKESDSARVLDSLARAWYLSGEPGKAAGLLRKAIAALGDRDPELRRSLEEKLARYVRDAEEAGLDVEEDA